MLTWAATLPGGDMQVADLPQLVSLQNSWVPTWIPNLAQVYSTGYLSLSQLCPFWFAHYHHVPRVWKSDIIQFLPFVTDEAMTVPVSC